MKKNIVLGLCGAAMLTCATVANAVPTSAIAYSTDGVTWNTVAIDEGAGDTFTGAGHVGIIHVEINVGGFLLDVVASKTFPAVGSPSNPIMDLGITGVSTGAGTLYVGFSATDFNPVPSGSFITTIAPNMPGVTETETTTISSLNGLFSAGTSFAPIGPVSGSPGGTGVGTAPALFGAPYSITLADKLVSSGAGLSISVDDRLGVPDGGNTLMLLGSGLAVLGMGMFRGSRKASAIKA